jgi:M6 family metalloprotease-like protein
MMRVKKPLIPLIKILLILFLLLILPLTIFSKPCPLGPQTLRQSDGTTFQALMQGDERYQHIETIDGYTILKEGDDWYYANVNNAGELVSTGEKVGKIAPESLALQKHLLPSPEVLKRTIESRLQDPITPIRHRPCPGLPGAEKYADDPTLAPALSGTGKMLVILADFSDKTWKTYTTTDFQTILFSDGTYTTGSLNDYYQEVSYGQYNVTGTIVDWVTTLPQTYDYYCNNQQGCGTWPQNSQKLCLDIVNAVDSTVDFSQYDTDSNGYVDCVTIIYEGTSEGGNNALFWPHAWGIPPAYQPTLDGKIISRYNIVNEYESAPSKHVNPCGTFCHEYGHVLGNPDLYDYDSGYINVHDNNDNPVVDWCLMSSGNYGYANGIEYQAPTHMCGLSRYFWMGWIVPTDISAAQTYTVKAIENNHDAQTLYRVFKSGSLTEFFLIENRYPQAIPASYFDKRFGMADLPLDEGLIIMHIDLGMNEPPYVNNRFNNGTPANPHYGCWVEDPAENLSAEPYEKKFDAAYCLGDGQIELGPSSTPYNSNWYDLSTGPTFSNISASGATMTFDLGGGGGGNETEPNDSFDQAQTVTLPAAINGSASNTDTGNITITTPK